MNAGPIKHMAQVRQLYGPNLGTLTDNLPSMGESLQAACHALADDCSLARIDELVSRLKTAQQSVTRLRLAVVEKWGTG